MSNSLDSVEHFTPLSDLPDGVGQIFPMASKISAGNFTLASNFPDGVGKISQPKWNPLIL